MKAFCPDVTFQWPSGPSPPPYHILNAQRESKAPRWNWATARAAMGYEGS